MGSGLKISFIFTALFRAVWACPICGLPRHRLGTSEYSSLQFNSQSFCCVDIDWFHICTAQESMTNPPSYTYLKNAFFQFPVLYLRGDQVLPFYCYPISAGCGSSPQSPVPGGQGRGGTSALLVPVGHGQQGFVLQPLQYLVEREKGMSSFVAFAQSRVTVT